MKTMLLYKILITRFEKNLDSFSKIKFRITINIERTKNIDNPIISKMVWAFWKYEVINCVLVGEATEELNVNGRTMIETIIATKTAF